MKLKFQEFNVNIFEENLEFSKHNFEFFWLKFQIIEINFE